MIDDNERKKLLAYAARLSEKAKFMTDLCLRAAADVEAEIKALDRPDNVIPFPKPYRRH